MSNANALIEPTFQELLAQNRAPGYVAAEEVDQFDPTDGGRKVVEPDDDFDDIVLETPQVCTLEECTSCQ